jgi:hypothetical protein
VLTLTGAVDPPHGPLRWTLSVIALVLIVPSAIFLLLR